MINDNLIKYLELALNAPGIEVRKLAGDASDRSFFRLFFPAPLENGDTTAVLMLMQSIPHDSELPYINVQRSMLSAGLPVPKIYHFSEDPPLIVSEDLGDTTLAEAVSSRDDAAVIELYRKAVELAVKIQVDGAEKMDPDCIAHSLAFDVDKLMFEFDFFYDNAIIKYKKCQPSVSDEKIIMDGFLKISETLAAEKRVMTHRDYHSRNLMIDKSGRMCMVDFQDARMGPRQYDLASLLLDSYVDLPKNIISELYEYYFMFYSEYSGENIDREQFDDSYDYMAIQRSIKAAGSFAYLDVVKEKNRYLQYFPTVLGYSRDILHKRKDLRDFHSALSKYVEEIG